MIYPKENNLIGCENSNVDIERKFVDEICEMVIETLSVSSNERRIVKPLLLKAFSEKINNRYKEQGLLQQYQQYVLDKSTESLIKELNLIAKVNHDNAMHAKLIGITTELKTLLGIK